MKKKLVLLQTMIDSDKNYVDACLLENVYVICVNRETKKNKSMPFKVMYDNNSQFWLQNEVWEYFLTCDDSAKVAERISKLNSQWGQPVIIQKTSPVMPKTVNEAPAATTSDADENADAGYGKGYKAIAAMTEAERVQHIKESKNRLDTLAAQIPRERQIIAEALVETTHDVVLYNHATLMDTISLSSDDAKKHTNELVESTRSLIKTSSLLVSENILNDDLVNTLVSKSDGTIIQHMTRVYLKGLAFLSFYNKLVSTSSIINKLRIDFRKNYLAFYHDLLPHMGNDISLEKVFLGGMRAIPENTFYDWAVGFLVHDIGKAAAMEYHEGAAVYNRDIVTEHVKIGYTSVMTKTNYPRDAGLIAGYHHEYYGDPSGYGLYRVAVEQHRQNNPRSKPLCCIAYDVEPMLQCEALAFFPAKLLEIIDVYDALTDSNRKYRRKALTAEEAIVMMRNEFIKTNRKIDPILFDLFSKFLQETSAS
ncbi:MAG: metal-dependent phosphohydrolase [Treponema sp.]|nr:metal-dependent phosphohydrolase [Treponema sp.]